MLHLFQTASTASVNAIVFRGKKKHCAVKQVYQCLEIKQRHRIRFQWNVVTTGNKTEGGTLTSTVIEIWGCKMWFMCKARAWQHRHKLPIFILLLYSYSIKFNICRNWEGIFPVQHEEWDKRQVFLQWPCYTDGSQWPPLMFWAVIISVNVPQGVDHGVNISLHRGIDMTAGKGVEKAGFAQQAMDHGPKAMANAHFHGILVGNRDRWAFWQTCYQCSAVRSTLVN